MDFKPSSQNVPLGQKLSQVKREVLQEMEAEQKEQERKAETSLKRRLALVGEIDKTEFQWKKRKREMQEEMARALAEHTLATEKAKEIREKIARVKNEDRRQVMQDKGKELGFKSVKLEE